MKTASKILSVTAMLLFAAAAAPRAAGQDAPRYEIKIEQVKAQPAMTMRFRAKPEELGQKYSEAFGALFGYVMSNGGEIAGRPYGRYLEMEEEQFEVEAGVPVTKVLAAKGEIKPGKLPGGTVATTMHVGPYEQLGNAHSTLGMWLEKSGKKAAGPVWEAYLTDPGEQPDPNKYQTKLFLPLEAADAAKPK